MGDRPFLLIPGIGVSSNYFERLADELHGFGPVHALDLPGFGGVPHPAGDRMRIRDYADLVAQVIETLQMRDPIVIGHSMGTQVVADLAARYRQDGRPLSSVVLLGPVVNRHERRLRTAIRRFLQAARREPPRVAVLAVNSYLLCGPRWFSRVLPEVIRYPIEEVLPHVESNTLVITGEHDTLCPDAWSAEVADLLPDARRHVIRGAAHSVMHANAAEVAALCVAHAERPGTAPLRVQVSADETTTTDALQAAAGQATELVGILTDDDETIAEGKSEQAEAIRPDQD